MRTEEVIIGGCAAIGVLVYFFAFLLPMKRASAAAGRPWRMYPVCFLGDYCDRVIARKEAEKQRLIDLARTRQAPSSLVGAQRALRTGTPTGAPNPSTQGSPHPPNSSPWRTPLAAARPPARPQLRQSIAAH